MVLDEEADRIEVVVPDDQLSLAIGRRGQNVRLASQLTGWDIDILTEAEESERRQKEFAERTQAFMEALDVDETVGQLLAAEGSGRWRRSPSSRPPNCRTSRASMRRPVPRSRPAPRITSPGSSREHDDRRRSLGVSDDLREIEGITRR